MDKSLILILARRHVAKGEKTLSRQRKVIAELEAGGHDTTMARQLLGTFEGIQARSVSEVERLRKELQPELTIVK